MDTGFRVVCRFDPALDPEAMGPDAVRKFRETGDVAHAQFREGERPTVYHCRRLKVSEMQAVNSYSTEADRLTAAFARGILRCEDLYSENGSRREWHRPDPERPVASSVIDSTFDYGEVQEVGAAIYGRSILGKGRPAAWPLPDTSRSAVGALAFHLAEQMRGQVASSAPSKSAADPAPATSG
jgi:hypothetical protein